MIKSIFITGTEANSGKFLISLGIMDLILGKVKKAAYFKPVISPQKQDAQDHINTVRSYFHLSCVYEDMFAFKNENSCCQMETEKQGEMLDAVIRKFKNLDDKNDFSVIEGTDFVGEGAAFEFDLNLQIAKNLSAHVILVINGEEKTSSQVVSNTEAAIFNLKAQEMPVLAVVVNKARPGNVNNIKAKLNKLLSPQILLIVIPEVNELKNLTVKEVEQKLQGKLLYGKELLLNPIEHLVVGAMEIPDLLENLKENTLVVAPGDRNDLITAVLEANLSFEYPKVAGMVLTDGYIPEKAIMKLINGLPAVIPVIASADGTAEAINEIKAIHSRITAADTGKIQLAIDTFHKFTDVSALENLLNTAEPLGITPRMFQYRLINQARTFKAKIVLPEGNDERILKVAARLVWLGLVDIILLGEINKIRELANRLNIKPDFDKIRIIDPATDAYFNDYANTLCELRKKEKMTLAEARFLMKNAPYFGTMMVYKGHADGMVGGAMYTTRQTILPALQFIKAREGKSLVSSIFLMCLKDRVVIFGDCAVNPDPTAEQLAEIAISSAETSEHFGIEPKIAMISYSSGASGVGEAVDKIHKATEIVKTKRPDLMIEGPIQYDAAVDPVIGAGKLPGSRVAGKATVLIFPDLNTGNTIYKAVQQEAGAMAIGPILQDLRKPVNDLSRGGTTDDIFNTILVTAIQCQLNKGQNISSNDAI
jgi:phosphate acetyltransferase